MKKILTTVMDALIMAMWWSFIRCSRNLMLHLPMCIKVTWTSKCFGAVWTAVWLLPSVLHHVCLEQDRNGYQNMPQLT